MTTRKCHLRLERLESRLFLTSHFNASVQLLQYDQIHSWYVGGDNLPIREYDITDLWSPVATGDFTADGITDVLGRADGEWWLKVNDGTQLFGVPWGESLPQNAQVLGKADFNDDGWLDLLARDDTTGEFWLARNSHGGFAVEKWGQFSSNVTWDNFFLRDFDNDGWIDVLARELTDGNWWLARNHGSGFQNRHWGRMLNIPWQSVIAGDFDGDQLGDIAARAEDNTWWVWRGTSTGLQPAEYWGHWRIRGNWLEEVAVGDFNADGRDDVLGRTRDDRLWVGLAGNSEFQTSAWSEVSPGLSQWWDVRVIDVDRDGDPDLVGRALHGLWTAMNTNQNMEVHSWASTNVYAGFVDYVTDFQLNQARDISDFFPKGESVSFTTTVGVESSIAEANRLKHEVVRAVLRPSFLTNAEVQILQQQQPDPDRWYLGTDHQRVAVHGVISEWNPIITGDFTADGVTDVLGQLGDEWWLQVNDGTQVFGVPWGESLATGAEILGKGDFNNDGWLDILAWDRSTGTFWLSRNSRNGFVTERWGQLSNHVTWSDFFVRDFDNDGLLDVMARETSGNWWLAKNHGAGFHNMHWGRLPAHDWLDIVVGDFDGDRFGDVAARAQNNTWWVWRGTAEGLTFSEYWGHWRMRGDWHDVLVGDFNSDGRDDLIARSIDDRLWVGISDDSKFVLSTWSRDWKDSADWTDVRVIDVDSDGAPDLVGRATDNRFWVAHNTGQEMHVYYWARGVSSGGFVDYVTGFTAGQGIPIANLLPGEAAHVETFANDRPISEDVRVTLNENNNIVLSGAVRELIGIDLQSPSGSLVPIQPGDMSASPAPFDFLLKNNPHHIAMGNLLGSVELSGDLVLNIGWDTDGVRDLRVLFGRRERGRGTEEAHVADTLFDQRHAIPIPEINRRIYAEIQI